MCMKESFSKQEGRPSVDQRTIDECYEAVIRGEEWGMGRRLLASWASNVFVPHYDVEVDGAYPGMRQDEYTVMVDGTETTGKEYAATIRMGSSQPGTLEAVIRYTSLAWEEDGRGKSRPVYGDWQEKNYAWAVTPAIVERVAQEKARQDKLDRQVKEQNERDFAFVKEHLGQSLARQDLPPGFSLVFFSGEGDTLTVTKEAKEGEYCFTTRDATGSIRDVIIRQE
jgi:hypothetical protein